MSLFEFLNISPIFFTVSVLLIGLVIGSFLNVVILRLPKMMEQDWREQCCELLEIDFNRKPESFNLIIPRSQCPHCGTMVKALDNIPVISFLLLKGKCRSCNEKISIRYPVIEILSGILAAVVAIYFGVSIQALAAAILSWSLICLSMIDYDHHLLPDDIILPLLWLGLILNAFGVFTDIYSALFGAVFGYLSLWIVYISFKILTGKEGMGYGDFKLLAMLGAWLGWQMLPVIIIISSLAGALIGVSMIMFKGHDKSKPIPFGPYLAIAGWITLIWGQYLTSAYINWALTG